MVLKIFSHRLSSEPRWLRIVLSPQRTVGLACDEARLGLVRRYPINIRKSQMRPARRNDHGKRPLCFLGCTKTAGVRALHPLWSARLGSGMSVSRHLRPLRTSEHLCDSRCATAVRQWCTFEVCCCFLSTVCHVDCCGALDNAFQYKLGDGCGEGASLRRSPAGILVRRVSGADWSSGDKMSWDTITNIFG